MALPSNVSVAKESDLAKLVESGRAKPLSKKKDDESSEDSDDNTTLWEMMHRSKNNKKKALSSSDDVPAAVSHEDGPIHQALPPRSDIVRGVSDELIGAKFDDLFQKDNNVPVRLAFTSWLSKICSLRPFRDDQGRIKKFPKQDPLIVHVSVTIFEIMISLLNIKIPGVKVTKKMIETKNLMMPREIGVILERATINAIRSKRSSYKRSERSGKKMVVSMEKDSDCDISDFDGDEELDNEMANYKTPEVNAYCNVIPIFFNYIYYVTFLCLI